MTDDPFAPLPIPEGRPDSEEHIYLRYDETYYTFLDIRPKEKSNDNLIFAPVSQWKDIYFFRDENEPTGWYRYEKPAYDWYLEAAIEKLNKLPEEQQATFDRVFVFDLRQAIRQKYQRNGSKAYELPACKNNRKAVGSWIERTFDIWGDNPDKQV